MPRYIERAVFGTLDMIELRRAAELPPPDFRQEQGQVIQTIWRHWLTAKAVDHLDLNLNDRQKAALGFMRINRRMDNARLRELTRAIYRTASRDLEDLVEKGVLNKVGRTGPGAHYVLAPKQDTNRTNKTSGNPDSFKRKPAKNPPSHAAIHPALATTLGTSPPFRDPLRRVQCRYSNGFAMARALR